MAQGVMVFSQPQYHVATTAEATGGSDSGAFTSQALMYRIAQTPLLDPKAPTPVPLGRELTSSPVLSECPSMSQDEEDHFGVTEQSAVTGSTGLHVPLDWVGSTTAYNHN